MKTVARLNGIAEEAARIGHSVMWMTKAGLAMIMDRKYVSGVPCTDCSMENRGNLSALFGESVIGDVELYLGCSSAERHASRYRRSVRRGGEAP